MRNERLKYMQSPDPAQLDTKLYGNPSGISTGHHHLCTTLCLTASPTPVIITE